MKKYFYFLLFATTFIIGCSDDDHVIIEPVETSGFYVCNEGEWGVPGTSSVSFYSFDENKFYSDYFLGVNGREIGDLPNQLAVYGSKMYCVVTGSGIIDVFEAVGGRSIKQIEMKTNTGASKDPRQIAFYQGKAYVCSFDNTVCRIDTASLTVEKTLTVGNNPDGICITNGKIYVSNSGGLGVYDNTVSVIDINKFEEKYKINVTVNPGKMISDNYGNIYVISRGDYSAVKSCLQRIDSKTDKLDYTSDFQASGFTIYDDLAYIYAFDYDENWHPANQRVVVYNVKTKDLETNNFISDGTNLDTPYCISVNPEDKTVYIANVADYGAKADILQFDTNGKLLKMFSNVGLNSNSIVFVEK